MLDPKDVARDSSIFTAQHRIVFPRSDGDANYGPPNTIAPPVTDVEVNYFHVFKRTEQKWVSWSRTVATKLANDYFNLPGDKWELQDFPKDYYMTEQRKGPRRTFRTDPYLYGSQGHRFRSTPEFMPHAFWLLCDPTLDRKNCTCIYCSKSSRSGGGGGGGSSNSREPSGRKLGRPAGTSRSEASTSQGANYRIQRIPYKIRAQAAPRGHHLPGVPLAVISCRQRNEDLAVVENKERSSDSEGFRPGEFAYCRLREPILGGDHSEHRIDTWPVLIESATMEIQVVGGENGKSGAAAAFHLQGRVQQKRLYDVVFLPTHEKARVDEARLIPGLMYRTPKELRKVDLGLQKDHAFLASKSTPVLNLENGQLPRPSFKETLFCFFYAVESVNNLRLLYTTTDQFSRADAGKAPVKNVVFMDGADGDTAAAATSHSTRPIHNTTDRLLQESTSQGNRFLSSTTQNNYMNLDGDDNHSRRRGALRQRQGGGGGGNAAAASSGSVPSSLGLAMPGVDDNTYWQGVLFGLERIWVGDLVRLRLSVEDVETMIASLAKGNDLYNAEDRTSADITSPYVLRIKAIYRTGKAEAEKTDDKIRVAGDVFRVLSLTDARAAEKKANHDQSSVRNSIKRGREETEEGNKSNREDEEAQRKRRATDTREGRSDLAEVKNEIIDVDEVEEVLSSRAGSDISSNKTKRSSRPSFEIPFRPFLEKAYEEQLPMTPTLPDGYGFQRVNQSSVEVVCSLPQLAGRLWSSMATRSSSSSSSIITPNATNTEDLPLEARVNAEKKKAFYGHEDSKDLTRITLSLVGLLPGSVKAMEVHGTEGLFLNRDRAIAEASKLALESGIKVLQKSTAARTLGQDSHHSDDSNGEVHDNDNDSDGHVDGRDHQLEENFNSDKQRNDSIRTSHRAKEGGKTDREKRLSLDSQAAAAAIIAASRVFSGPSSSKAAATTTTTTNDKSSNSDMAASGARNGTQALNHDVPGPSTGQVATPLPPLPPNWIIRQSRSGQGQYYANIKTKQTSWDRPMS